MLEFNKNNSVVDLVIGLTGHKAGGKDVVANFLVDRGFKSCRLSDLIREEAAMVGLVEPSMTELQVFSNKVKASAGDAGYWASRAAHSILGGNDRKWVVNGLRNPAEINSLKKLLGQKFLLFGITAPIDLRFSRASNRKQSGDPLELWQWLKMDDMDRGVGQPPDGQQVERCLAMVEEKFLYCNSGTLEEMKNWIELAIESY